MRQPDSVLLFSPWLDVSVSDPANAALEHADPFLSVFFLKAAGEALASGPSPVDTKDPGVSPIYGSLAGLPPVSVWSSTRDMLLPDSRRLRDRFAAEGVRSRFRFVEREGLTHDWWMWSTPESFEAIREAAAAVREDCAL